MKDKCVRTHALAFIMLAALFFSALIVVPVESTLLSITPTELSPLATYTNLNVSTARNMIDSRPHLVILDVRLAPDYDSGHLRNAKLIPMPDLAERLDELSITDEILVYDESGNWSATASQTLVDAGFLYVFNMLGGLNAWIAEGYPVFTKYPSIQEAINTVAEAGTLFISSGTYGENLVLNKSLSIVGENIQTTVIDGSNDGSAILVTASNCSIQGFTITNGNPGIYLDHADNSTILRNNVDSNRDGVFVNNSHNCMFLQNSIQNNTVRGILIINSSSCTIANNRVTENIQKGIGLTDCNNCSVIENRVEFNTVFGVSLDSSRNNSIFHNSFFSNGIQATAGLQANQWDDGFPSGGNFWSDYREIHSNAIKLDGAEIWDIPYTINGLNQDNYPLVYPFGQPIWNLNTNSYYATLQGAINALETADGHVISVSIGTYYEHVVVNKSVCIIGNQRDETFMNGRGGGTGFNVTVPDAVITGFTIESATHGVYLQSSNRSTINGNTITNTTYAITLSGCSHNNHISDNLILGVSDGVVLAGVSDNNTVVDNVISGCGNAGLIVLTRDNLVSGNTFFNGTVGIYANGTNNTYYHNNLVDNKFQATGGNQSIWDNGCEGNYWSDYSGIDFNSDGIGDSHVPWNGLDYYPLINLYWNPGDINHDLIVNIFDVVIISAAYGSMSSDSNWNGHCDLVEPYGTINIFDVVIITYYYGEIYGA